MRKNNHLKSPPSSNNLQCLNLKMLYNAHTGLEQTGVEFVHFNILFTNSFAPPM